jgi:uncharacterized membrane protein HdeD (DUF308 family)
MILLSIIIFNNPDTVLAAVAFWLGLVVAVTGLIGVIGYFANPEEQSDFSTLLWSGAVLIIGILMVSKMLVTLKAITLVFGILVAIVGIALIYGSWTGRQKWSLWWTVALIGVIVLILGIASITDFNSGVESISTLIGVSVLISGIGLIFLALLKRQILLAERKTKYRYLKY